MSLKEEKNMQEGRIYLNMHNARVDMGKGGGGSFNYWIRSFDGIWTWILFDGIEWPFMREKLNCCNEKKQKM